MKNDIPSGRLSEPELELLDLAVLCAAGGFEDREHVQRAEEVLAAARVAASNSRIRPMIVAIVAAARAWRDGRDGAAEIEIVGHTVQAYFRERLDRRRESRGNV